MGYCGECQHWTLKQGQENVKPHDAMGTCGVSGMEAANMRHGCIMYTMRRKLEESSRSPIDNFKLSQNN